MEKIWVIQKRKYDDFLKQLLYLRGVDVSKEDEIEHYLNPDFDAMADPNLLPDMKKAIKRIVEAKNSAEKIGIFADYDADGIPGGAFLAKAFDRLGILHEIFIPSREEGYGLSEHGIDFLSKEGASLIVTVDLGIRNTKEANYCKSKKIDLIITDHHIPGEEIPDCLAVVNPKITSSNYPFRELSGAGVAYKLVQALADHFPDQLSESFLKWNLDLIAISTISDVVPLSSENRIIAHYGLRILKKSKNVGINSIIKFAKIDQEKIREYTVAFQIGPRINAPSRIDNATKSYQILVTDDKREAYELAKWLEEKNLERGEAMDRVQNEASQKIVKEKLDTNNLIVVNGKNWPKGVIGPAASRLVEKFNRPIIVLSQKDDVLTGSARSLGGIDIIDIIGRSKRYLVKFGGHKGAAGLTLKLSDFDKFKKSIFRTASGIGDEDLKPKINIDLNLLLKNINIKLIDELNKLEPFGMGNPKPVFASFGVNLLSCRTVGRDGKHLSLLVGNGEDEFKAIYFNCEDIEILQKMKGQKIDIAYSLSIDEWNGQKKPSLSIVDIKAHDGKKS